MKLRPMKALPSSILSSNPKSMQQVPVVKIPMLNTFLAPNLDRFFPKIGLAIKTVNSKIPKTKPYSAYISRALSNRAVIKSYDLQDAPGGK